MTYDHAQVTLRHLCLLGAAAFFCSHSVASAQDASDAEPQDGESREYETYPPVKAGPAENEAWRQDVLVALIGGGPRFRNVRLDVGDFMGGTENRSLDTGAYFDFGWHLLIRPLGQRSPRASVRAIVLQIDGGSGIGLQVQPAESGIALNTNSWRLLGQFGYLYPLDKLLVGGLVGVGGDIFNIDLNSVLPSSRIIYVRLGPAVEWTAISDYLAIRADFGLRLPFRLGELEDAFGSDSRSVGLDGAVTIGGKVNAGFTYKLRFVWEYYHYRFAGEVANVPSMGDGGSGHEHALNLQLLVGWSL
jgi:hypothetical protein